MRIRVLRDRWFVPPENHLVTVRYLKGQELTVKREWGDALVRNKDAEEIDPPSRQAKD